jgi:hypothetical protein
MAAVPRSSLPYDLAPSTPLAPANGNARSSAGAPCAAARTFVPVGADFWDGLVLARPSKELREVAAAWAVFLALAVIGTALF